MVTSPSCKLVLLLTQQLGWSRYGGPVSDTTSWLVTPPSCMLVSIVYGGPVSDTTTWLVTPPSCELVSIVYGGPVTVTTPWLVTSPSCELVSIVYQKVKPKPNNSVTALQTNLTMDIDCVI